MSQDTPNDNHPRGMSDREFLLGPEARPANPLRPTSAGSAPQSDPGSTASRETAARIKSAGLALSFVGGLALFLSAMNLVDAVSNFQSPQQLELKLAKSRTFFPEDMPLEDSHAEMRVLNKYGFFICFGAISLICAAIIVIGSLQMQKQQGFALAIISAVLAIVTCPFSCCVGIPVGIWALTVLLRDDVRSAFH